MRNTFSKEERLCSKRLIDSLFHNGSSFIVYPYRVVLLPVSALSDILPAQVLISVPKRRFKHAVDRNLLKRRMKESYRLQKAELYTFLRTHSLHLLIAFQYVGKEKHPFHYLHERMRLALLKIMDESVKHTLGKGD